MCCINMNTLVTMPIKLTLHYVLNFRPVLANHLDDKKFHFNKMDCIKKGCVFYYLSIKAKERLMLTVCVCMCSFVCVCSEIKCTQSRAH